MSDTEVHDACRFIQEKVSNLEKPPDSFFDEQPYGEKKQKFAVNINNICVS